MEKILKTHLGKCSLNSARHFCFSEYNRVAFSLAEKVFQSKHIKVSRRWKQSGLLIMRNLNFIHNSLCFYEVLLFLQEAHADMSLFQEKTLLLNFTVGHFEISYGRQCQNIELKFNILTSIFLLSSASLKLEMEEHNGYKAQALGSKVRLVAFLSTFYYLIAMWYKKIISLSVLVFPQQKKIVIIILL